MTIDALAFESHFLDHLAPVWRSLPADLRGTLFVAPDLESRAVDRHAVELDPRPIRAAVRHPYPDPGDGPTALVASYGDIKVGRRLGYRRFVFLEHGAGQSYAGDRRHGSHGSYAGGEDREDVALFLVPNTSSAERWRRAYPDAEVEVVGCPKLDVLPGREPGPTTVAISFHWDAHIIPEARSALGHYKPILPELAKRYRLIGHGHPRAGVIVARIYRRLGIEWVPEFADVSRRADVYVCDNSSTLFEFASTDRPVVVLNAPWYRRNVDHGLRFWQAATVGEQVDEPGRLVAAIDRALEPETAEAKARRDAALSLVYTVREGATGRAASAIARLGGL